MRRSIGLGVVFGCVSMGAAVAGRFDPARVPAGAAWVAHVDVEALARSELYGLLAADGTVRLEDEVEQLKELGIEPLKDLRSVCVYGVGERAEHEVLLLAGTANLETALERLVAQMEGREEELDGRRVFVWEDACYATVLRNEGGSDRVVVQSDDRAALARACDVLAGRAPSLAGREEPRPRLAPAEGSILFAAATTRLADVPGIELASSVAHLADDFVLDLGEAHGELFAHLAVDAKDAKEARQIQQVLQGAVALLALAAGQDEESGPVLQDLAAGFRFHTEDATVHGEFRISTRLLLDDLRALDEDRPHARRARDRDGAQKK